jgi:hypothetical protein
MGMARRCRFLGAFGRALWDAVRPLGALPRPVPVAHRIGFRHERAACVLLRVASALCFSPRCRRCAFVLCNALRRDGAPAELCFGIRAGPGAIAGHVWVESPGRETSPGGYAMTVRPHGTPHNNGWHRG